MFIFLGLASFFSLLFLKKAFLLWNVETVVFLFFVILMFILITLIRFAVLKSINLKIWFVYSLLDSLVLLNLSLLKKLSFIANYINFRVTYFLLSFFCYYFFELSNVLYNKLQHLNYLKINSFALFLNYSFFFLKFNSFVKKINSIFIFNELKKIALYKFDVKHLLYSVYLLELFIKWNLLSISQLGVKKVKVLNGVFSFLN